MFPVPCSLFPVPCSLFPVPRSLFPRSLFPIPCSSLPVPCFPFPVLVFCSLFPVLCSLFPAHCSLFSVSLFSVACCLFPVPRSFFFFPVLYSLFHIFRSLFSQFLFPKFEVNKARRTKRETSHSSPRCRTLMPKSWALSNFHAQHSHPFARENGACLIFLRRLLFMLVIANTNLPISYFFLFHTCISVNYL